MTVSVSVELLLPPVGSVVPAGGATVATFETEPDVAVTLAVTVMTYVPPDAMTGVTKPASSCATVGAVVQPAPHATAVLVRPVTAGSVSVAVDALGPAFVTVMV